MIYKQGFKTLYSYQELLRAWTIRTIRVRYQQSLLGGLWAILQPAATAIIVSIVFTRFIPVDTGGPPYIVFSYTAMVPWTLFTAGISDMVNVLVENMNLVTKIYFPREILTFAALLARLVDFAIAFLVLIILMLIYQQPFYLLGWLFLPLIILIQCTFMLGLGLLGGAINIFYRDVKHVIILGLQLWFYASPVIYPITLVPERYHTLYFLNPMAGILEAYRAVLLYETLPDSSLWLSAIVAVVTLFLGYTFFKKVEFQFADVV